jgi:hypothetical protein
MRRRLELSVLLAAVALGSVRTEAQDAATIADIRCVIVGMQLSGMANSPQQSSGILLTWYYIGRLDGRAPKLEIESLLIAEANKMSSSDYASEAKRCGAGLTERGQQVTQVGKDLIERGKKMPYQQDMPPK